MRRTTLGDLARWIMQLPEEQRQSPVVYRLCVYGEREEDDEVSYHYVQFLAIAEEDIEPRMIKDPTTGEERKFCTVKKGDPFLCDL